MADTIGANQLPWRRRATARAQQAKASLEREEAEARLADEKRQAQLEKAREKGVFAEYVKPVIVPFILAIVAFYSGQVSEQLKQRGADERLAVENRRRLFVETAQDFGVYLAHWSRLRVISKAQDALSADIVKFEEDARNLAASGKPLIAKDLRQLSRHVTWLKDNLKLVDARKERYVIGRDDAKDKLAGKFEQSRLFFGQATTEALGEYEQFDRANGVKAEKDMPSIDEWRARAVKVFEQMRSEIRDDEERLKSPSSYSLAAR